MSSDTQPSQRQKKRAHLNEEKYIHEDADNIVDLADIKAMRSIASKSFKSNIRCEYNIVNSLHTNKYS